MQAILFDLDGTLLPMDMDAFTQGYFALLVRKAAPRGYAPKALVDGIWKGTKAMVANDGSMTNRERFWQAFAEQFGEDARRDETLFDSFYRDEFREAVRFTDPAPALAQRAVRAARACAQQVILATNPIFPLAGVETRLGWLGLKASDFDYVTSYENASFCKPNPLYYEEILRACHLQGADCLMVGNDAEEDALPAAAVGLQTYLVRDCLIQRQGGTVPCASGTLASLPDVLMGLSPDVSARP